MRRSRCRSPRRSRGSSGPRSMPCVALLQAREREAARPGARSRRRAARCAAACRRCAPARSRPSTFATSSTVTALPAASAPCASCANCAEHEVVDCAGSGREAHDAARELDRRAPARSRRVPGRRRHRRTTTSPRCAPRAGRARPRSPLLERRRRRQDEVRVARRLVDVEVDRDQEVERPRTRARAARSSAALRSGLVVSRIIARTWPSPGVSISSAIVEDGISRLHLGLAAHAALPAADLEAVPVGQRGVERRRRRREHHAARAVEVAGEDARGRRAQLASVPNSCTQVPSRP